MHPNRRGWLALLTLGGLGIAGCVDSNDNDRDERGESALLERPAVLQDAAVLEPDLPYPSWLPVLLFEELETLLPGTGVEDGDTLDCDGGEGTIAVYAADLPYHGQYDEELLLNFVDCRPLADEDLVLNGGYRYRYGFLEEDDATYEGEQWVVDLTGTYDDHAFEASLQQSLGDAEHPDSDRQVLITSEPHRTWRFGDWVELIRDWQVFSESEIGASTAEVTISGRVAASHLDGYMEVTTPDPLEIHMGESCFESGRIRYEGDGAVVLRYGPDTGTSEVLVIEFNDQRVAGFDSCEAAAEAYPWLIGTD